MWKQIVSFPSLLTVTLVGFLGISPFLTPALTPVFLVATGFLAILLIAKRVSADCFLHVTLTVSYFFKVGLALALFFVSLWRLPVLGGLQLSDGFWYFGQDSLTYHSFAESIAAAWQKRGEFPHMGAEAGQNVYVGTIYYLLGTHPLHVILLNAWYTTLAALMAFLLTQQFTDDIRSARIAAMLIAFWPSMILWSTQILKDSLVIFLILAELYLLITIWSAPPGSLTRRGFRWIGAVLVVFFISLFRPYIGMALGASCFLIFGMNGFVRAWRHGVRDAVKGMGLAFMVIAASLIGGRINLERLANPVLSPTTISSGEELRGFDIRDSLAELRSAFEDRNITFYQYLLTVLKQVSPEYIGFVRQVYIKLRRDLPTGEELPMLSLTDALQYLPRGLATVFFAPFPWQWVGGGEPLNVMRPLAGLEMMIIYFLLPSLAVCLWNLWRKRDIRGWFLLVFILGQAVVFAIAIPNLGTLFRLRLQLLFPLMILLVSTTSLFKPYSLIFGKISAFLKRH